MGQKTQSSQGINYSQGSTKKPPAQNSHEKPTQLTPKIPRNFHGWKQQKSPKAKLRAFLEWQLKK
jgi:hypothetical protein